MTGQRAILTAFGIPGPVLGPSRPPQDERVAMLLKMVSLGFFTMPAGGLDEVAIRNAIDSLYPHPGYREAP